MNILTSEKPFSLCVHNYKIKTEWSTFERKDDCNERIKKRWTECRICKKKNSLIPFERETYGSKLFHGQITEILGEEQQELAFILLSEMFKGKNNKQWPPLKKKLLTKFLFEVLDSTIVILHDHGILKFRWERVKLDEVIKQIIYNTAFEKDICTFLGIQDEQLPEWITNPFPPLTNPTTAKSRLIWRFLLKQQTMFEKTQQGTILSPLTEEIIVTSTSSAKGYFKLIRIVYGIYENVEQNRKEYWKTFSQRILGDTKVIKKVDKQRLEQLFGKALEEFGILSERTEVLLSGDFSWSYNGHINTSLAFKDYLSFPRDMIHEMDITSWNSSSLLIIENPALFFSVVKSHLLDTQEWSVLLGSGFISSQEIDIIIQAANKQLKKVYIWPDLDPYGYQITHDIYSKIKAQNISVYLFGYSIEWFKRVDVYKPLAPYDVQVIAQLLKDEMLHEEVRNVLIEMNNSNKKAEQEILFSHLEKEVLLCWLEQSIRLY